MYVSGAWIRPHISSYQGIKGLQKTVYLGVGRWLCTDHPWRKCGELFNGEDEPEEAPRPRSGTEIDELLKNWKECPTPGKKRPKVDLLLGVWKARAVFHNLPYWKVLKTPHSLDMMHITKNVTEILLGTLSNMPKKTKDGMKARDNLKWLGVREIFTLPIAMMMLIRRKGLKVAARG